LSADDEIGIIHYSLAIPALDLAGYAAIQREILGTMSRKPLWKRLTNGLVPSILVGVALGFLIGPNDWSIGLYIGEDSDGWFFDGIDMLIFVLGLMLLTLAAVALMGAVYRARFLRHLHVASGEMLGAHVLRFGDDGILWRNGSRVIVTPWSHITGLRPGKEQLLIVADRVSLFWVQEEVLAALPDRDALIAFIRSKMPPDALT
jgi:hypothetical protein